MKSSIVESEQLRLNTSTSSRKNVEMPLDEEIDVKNDGDDDDADTDDADDDADYFELEEDIFSLLFVSEVKSMCKLFSLCVFVVQVVILFLTYNDLMRDDDRNDKLEPQDDNPFNIPISVKSTSVAVSQFLALIIAVVSQQDVLVSIDALFAVKYDRHVVVHAGLPHATLFRWRLYNTLRWIEGTVH
jgi:hypothetical protein